MRFRRGPRLLWVLGVAALVWVLCLPVLHGRKEPSTHQEPERLLEAPARGPAPDEERIIALATDIQEKSGIVVAPLAPVSYQEEISAYGTVLPLQDLIDLWSTTAAARAQVATTQTSLGVSRKEYDRLKGLHTANQNISDKALQAAEAAWRADEAHARAAQEALQVVERTARQRWGNVLAEWLSDTSPAFDRLMQQRDVLLQITVPVGVSLVSAPQTATVQGADGAGVSAKLVSPAPYTDPRLQGISFFYLAPAQIPGLLTGMNIRASLPVGPQVPGVVVPASSVVWWQGKAWVYAQRDVTHFARREIPTHTPLKADWFVAEGLAVGQPIVVSGAQLLLSEEFRSQMQISEEGDAS